MAERPYLERLAGALGIAASYRGYYGKLCCTDEATYEALIAAMGYDASSEAKAEEALIRMQSVRSKQVIDKVRVEEGSAPAALHLPVNFGALGGAGVEWEIQLIEEHGAVHSSEGKTSAADQPTTLALPSSFAATLGYHTVQLTLRAAGTSFQETQRLILCPPRCFSAQEALSEKKGWGSWTHMYSLRNPNGFGIGDLRDLKTLIDNSAAEGACFIGINPLHAAMENSISYNPYFPSSRLFRSPLYLDPQAFQEYSICPELHSFLESPEAKQELGALREASQLDYPRIQRFKYRLFRLLFRQFCQQHRDGGSPRGQAFYAFVDKGGKALSDFATYCALQERLPSAGQGNNGFYEWPEQYQSPESPSVESFRQQYKNEIDFHLYLQFEMETQLAHVHEHAQAQGMPLGLYQDLALGNAPGGSDIWSFGSLFARGATVGAPPDPFSSTGQQWSLSPLCPRALREGGYRFWSDLLRASCRYAGVLRIDHVMGLSRQFWIPKNKSPKQGAYVGYPEHDLLGILALESLRHHCVMIGEDLGIVPEHLRQTMQEQNILRSQVFYFERDEQGEFRDAQDYAQPSLVTATTHDLPTIAGFWQERDLLARQEAGQITESGEFEALCQERIRDQERLVRLFRRLNFVSPDWTPADTSELAPLIHAFLAKTPCILFGVSVDDLAGELESVNVPGTYSLLKRNWSRRMNSQVSDIRFTNLRR
ncbi:MAG: 4-alpha-glucanotransferase [Myxococcales bacterium]|nr:MAG: 4-alpha-glucanotransferase [Myxococcales bacterium]